MVISPIIFHGVGFFINIPVGLLALYLVNLFVEDTPESVKKKVQTIDYIGLSLIALG